MIEIGDRVGGGEGGVVNKVNTTDKTGLLFSQEMLPNENDYLKSQVNISKLI